MFIASSLFAINPAKDTRIVFVGALNLPHSPFISFFLKKNQKVVLVIGVRTYGEKVKAEKEQLKFIHSF